ncbi:MAG: hypothetical protein AB7U85_09620, partial [Alphaproteobacteria bacterium]
MSGGISLTASMRSNLQSLQYTQELFDNVQERLSTGNKVNSALDNPNSYFTAASLNNRASDLDSLMDSMGQGVQTLKAADQGIETLTSLVEQAQSLTTTALDASIIDSEISGTLKIEDYTNLREISGVKWNDAFVISSKEDGQNVKSNINRAVSRDTTLSSLDETFGTKDADYQFMIVTKGGDNGDKSANIRLSSDATVGDLIDSINANTSVDLTASIDDDGNLVISSNDNSIVTIRDDDYNGEALGNVDLSGSGTLSEITGGQIAAGTAYTFFVNRSSPYGNNDGEIQTKEFDATAGDLLNSLEGASSALGANAKITFMLNDTVYTADLIADSNATTAGEITLENVFSAFSQIAALATVYSGDATSPNSLNFWGNSGESIVFTGGDTNGLKIIDTLGLMDNTETVTVSGGDSVEDLVDAFSNSAIGIKAEITPQGYLSVVIGEDVADESDLTIVSDNANGKSAITTLFGDIADASKGIFATDGKSKLSSAFGYDDYNLEIVMPNTDPTAEKLVDAINDAATAANLDITASIVDKKLVITDNLGNDLSIFDVNGGEAAEIFGIAQTDTTGTNARAEYAQQFDDLRTQMNELVQDTGYKGVNLLKGDDL